MLCAALYCASLVDWDNRLNIGALLQAMNFSDRQVHMIMQLRLEDAFYENPPNRIQDYKDSIAKELTTQQFQLWQQLSSQTVHAVMHTLPLHLTCQTALARWRIRSSLDQHL